MTAVRSVLVVQVCQRCDEQPPACSCSEPDVIGVLCTRVVGTVREAFYTDQLISSMNAQPRRSA